jgi:Spy/CpxP family protein refolding chaperone
MNAWLVVVSLGVLIGALTSNVQAKQPTLVAATPVVVLMPFLTDNPDFFSLTSEQRHAVTKIAQASSAKREAIDQSVLDLRAELREELFKFKVDAKLIKQLSDELARQEAARVQLSIECAKGLRSTLTAEQWKTLTELALQ